MALTPSTMLPLGTAAPDFSLKDTVTGKTVSLGSLAGKKALLVMFICNHCPYVKHIQQELANVARDYARENVATVAISSNDAVQYPDDGPDGMREQARELGFNFPYLYDESQDVARAYEAACTPDFFLFDGERRLVYRGQFDDSRPQNGKPATGADLRRAVDEVIAGRQPAPDQRPSLGCNIKWKE
jgi:peroxiredoxin